ncbi:hypothetical protein SUNI508_03265 [Seiridium unicorne]|uniref:gamma-glutamylcyclotransferase n=1 Tax=Seiridium unicorne TaxID=138068 RepID=A0ABR2VDX1_9PEZI
MAALEEANATACYGLQAQQSINHIWQSLTMPDSSPDYPLVSSIPRTSVERLAQASPDYDGPKSASSVLYLAYGSNLSAHTFLDVRGIRPISSINVSAPALDLTFDLPGLPYRDPCFANTAPRKIPRLPLPGDPPRKPPIDLPPRSGTSPADEKRLDGEYGNSGGDSNISFPALPIRGPTWSKGLYGVVYEVTPSDYHKIVATEGGSAFYTDIATLCIALPPAIHVPEQPPIPDLKPFLAHTLFAPRLPTEPPPTDKWWQKFLLPVRRAEADYAQPSLRYLRLIREGAAEHFLPLEYQEYLQKLEHYTITRRRQELGKWLFTLLWAPLFLLLLGLGKVFSSKENGKLPKWLAAAMAVMFNLAWMSYDAFFKDRFGDGERTMDDEDENKRSWDRRTTSRWHGGEGAMSEKNKLLSDW